MTQNRMFANASLRPSGSTVTHGMSGSTPDDIHVCQCCGKNFRPNRHWQKQCSPRCRQRAYVLRHPTTTLYYYGA